MTEKTFQGWQFVEMLQHAPFPMVMGWNRLEGRPRTDDFDATLRAEVRDPLWMLTRQHQLGEFRGNDAGSPVFAKVKVATTRIDRYRVKEAKSQPYDESVPLETRVERRPLPMHLSLRLQIGRYWCRLLDKAKDKGRLSKDYKPDFRKAFPITLPDPKKIGHKKPEKSGAWVYAHQEAWQLYSATAGRSVDGGTLLQKCLAGGDILDGISVDADENTLRELEKKLHAWIERQYNQPEDGEASPWAPSHLEYQFACSAPDYHANGQIVLIADEYHRGHLDWYSFDIHPGLELIEQPVGESHPAPRVPEEMTFDFIPTMIEFGGMPNIRWWEFEDRKTDFGSVDAHTTDLAKLLLIEFGLIYANDWFLLPFELPVGSLARVDGLAVTNVFGERIWIGAAGSGENDGWQRWAMYNLNVRGADREADRSVFIPPAVDRLQESRPIEEVHLIRDEMANMVWGVEATLNLPSGDTKNGFEAATEFVDYLRSLIPPQLSTSTDEEIEAAIKYVLMTSVPENWIPFIPVRMPTGTNREIQLQRAAMLRSLIGSTERPKIRPRTDLLRHNFEGAYFIHEEEVPRAGTHVLSTFQRARWHNGKVCVWLGNRKRTGRGEGSSGLRFDQIEPTSTKSADA